MVSSPPFIERFPIDAQTSASSSSSPLHHPPMVPMGIYGHLSASLVVGHGRWSLVVKGTFVAKKYHLLPPCSDKLLTGSICPAPASGQLCRWTAEKAAIAIRSRSEIPHPPPPTWLLLIKDDKYGTEIRPMYNILCTKSLGDTEGPTALT